MPLQRDDRPSPPDMTDAEALAEARRRWGPSGDVQTTPRESGGTWKHVGILETFPVRQLLVRGVGGRWDRAFIAADLDEARAIEMRSKGRSAARPGGRRRRQR